MKRKEGFTLVELLAVIVVLGIVSAIALTSITKVRKESADKTFEKLEKQIADLGPDIYSHEVIVKSTESFYTAYKDGTPFIIRIGDKTTAGTLIGAGYIDEIKSPYNSSITCDGYLYVNPSDTDETYKGFLDCGSKETDGYDASQPEATISSIN